MRPRFYGLALIALLCSATAAFADRPAPESTPLEPGPFESITPGPIQPNGPCVMGQSTGAAVIVNYLLPPNDAYYTLIDPAACSCPNASIAVQMAHVFLSYPVACTQPVTVSIVAAIDDGNGCLRPDPANKLCAPLAYNLTVPAAGNYIFNLPMPANCCITSKSFLEINFVAGGAGCSTSATRPRLVTDQSCDPCTSYNIYPGGNDDLCLDAGFPGNPIMYVDGDCCSTVPAENQSWGRVKSLYR